MKTVTLGRTAVVHYDFALEYADPSKVPVEPLTSPIKADNKTISFPGTATIEGNSAGVGTRNDSSQDDHLCARSSPDHMKDPHAQALGRMGKGKPKTRSIAATLARMNNLEKANAARREAAFEARRRKSDDGR